VFQVERGREDKVYDAGCRIGEPALFQPQKPAEIRGPLLSPARRYRALSQVRPHTLKIKVRACATVNFTDQYKMQDPNHWYRLQRSNTGQHAYSIQDSASNTPSLPPAGLHDNQALSPVYSFASAVRPTQGESFSPSLDTNYSPYMPQCPVTFPIYPWSHIRLHMHNPNTSAQIAVNLLHQILPHTRSMRLS
jgi:hypothetical protein